MSTESPSSFPVDFEVAILMAFTWFTNRVNLSSRADEVEDDVNTDTPDPRSEAVVETSERLALGSSAKSPGSPR